MTIFSSLLFGGFVACLIAAILFALQAGSAKREIARIADDSEEVVRRLLNSGKARDAESQGKIDELQAKNDELQAKNDELQAKVDALEEWRNYGAHDLLELTTWYDSAPGFEPVATETQTVAIGLDEEGNAAEFQVFDGDEWSEVGDERLKKALGSLVEGLEIDGDRITALEDS